MKIKTKKIKMSQIFDPRGRVIPVSVLEVLNPPEKQEELEALKGNSVEVRGTSKGKGFTGVMKRWGFSGHPATHGHFAMKRHPGSIGAQGEGRVMPFKKMAGRSGGKKVYVKGLRIVGVEGGSILVSGPVPGHRGGVVEVTVLETK